MTQTIAPLSDGSLISLPCGALISGHGGERGDHAVSCTMPRDTIEGAAIHAFQTATQ